MKRKLVRFLKIYLVFMLFVLVINLSVELLISPENRKTIAEQGWSYFVQHQLVGIIIFFVLFSLVGAMIFLKKKYKPKKMEILSFIIGFALEFIFMKPEWVQNIYALKIGEDVIGAVIGSSFYWLAAWGIPSYIIHTKDFLNSKN